MTNREKVIKIFGSIENMDDWIYRNICLENSCSDCPLYVFNTCDLSEAPKKHIEDMSKIIINEYNKKKSAIDPNMVTNEKKLTIAVDFDGVLVQGKGSYPDAFKGVPVTPMIEALKEMRRRGHKVILWTCREGEPLHNALDFCEEYGLEFDAVNDNTEEQKALWGNNCRKVAADAYIDDKSLGFYEFIRLVNGY